MHFKKKKQHTHLFVSESLSVDEEPVTAEEVQVGRSHLAHAHSAKPAPILSQPATARVVPRHYHCLHAHQVVVTAATNEGKGQEVSAWRGKNISFWSKAWDPSQAPDLPTHPERRGMQKQRWGESD